MKLLVVDDHACVRRGIREILAEGIPGATIAEAASGDEALALAGRERPDLVVLDISMPGRSGLDALKELRARTKEVAVLVLSQHAEEQYAVRALRSGARGYLNKASAPEELLRAVEVIARGGTYVGAAAAAHVASALRGDPDAPLHASLSDRELEVLRLLAVGKSVRTVAAELVLSDKTVSTYRARLLGKMGMRSNAELMRYALRAGLVD